MGSFIQKFPGKVEAIANKLIKEKDRLDLVFFRKMKLATEIVYRTAHAKRPMMSKAQMKKEGRTRRVSDPNAKLGVPVRTGELQASIKREVVRRDGRLVGRVWTDKFYGPFMEFGTSRVAARPFMRPALFEQNDKIKSIFKNNDNA